MDARERHQSIREFLALDAMVTRIATRFVDVGATEIEPAIAEALAEIGEFTGVARVHVGRIDSDGTVRLAAHEWCAPGVAPPVARRWPVPGSALPWSLPQLAEGRRLHVTDVDDATQLPAPGREELEYLAAGVTSFAMFPLRLQGSLLGFLGFDTVVPLERHDDDRVAWLEVLAELVGHLVARQQANDRLQHHLEAVRDRLDALPVAVYRTTPGGRILYVNRTLCRMLGFENFHQLAAHPLDDSNYAEGYPRQRFIQRIEREGRITDLHSAWTRRDGTVCHVRENAVAVRGPEGVTRYYEGIVEEIDDVPPAASA